MADKISELIKRASAAAEAAPENLREAAFNKAFDALMAAEGSTLQGGTPKSRTQRTAARQPAKPMSAESADASGASLDQLDRTAHPDIQHGNTSLDNSLRLLRAARNDLGIDGLTAGTIAKVLGDKFRCRITRQAVSLALNGAGRYVDRRNEGANVIFRIMGPGEDHLDALSSRPSGTAAARRSSTKRSVPKVNGRAASATARSAKPAEAAPAASRPGPAKTTKADKTPGGNKSAGQRSVSAASALKQIHAAGFFSSPRTIGAIIDHLKHKHGRSFKAFEMSTPLVRLLRAGGLTRDRNKDNQYEYKQP